MRSFILLSCPSRPFTFLRYQLSSSSRLFWYSLNYNYFLISKRFKFSCLCSYFSILSYISAEAQWLGGSCSLYCRWLSVLQRLLRMREEMLSALLVTSMLAVLIERQFIIFSILFRANVQFCGFRPAMSNRNQSYNNSKMSIQQSKEGGRTLSSLLGENIIAKNLNSFVRKQKRLKRRKQLNMIVKSFDDCSNDACMMLTLRNDSLF